MVRTTMIPTPTGEIITWFYGDGTTADIMHVVQEVDKMKIRKGFGDFAKQFKPTYQGLYHLWAFVRNKITYRADSENPLLVQDVKDPYSLWYLGVGDCKSKTIFINAVLRCLGIPHFIRYASYDGNNYTHVYTVAFLNGQKIIIDSVFDYFDKEADYLKIKDVDNMNGTTIRSIHGIGKNTTSVDACARLEELKQRKAYVPPQEPIAFNEISEGKAALMILERRFKILAAMSDEKILVEKGLNMIQQAINKGTAPTGVIDDNLQGVGFMIDKFLKQQGTKAINEGINAQRFKVSYQRAINELKAGGVGSYPEYKCIWDDWHYQYSLSSPNDFARNNDSNNRFSPSITCGQSMANAGLNDMLSRKERMFYFYGLNSEFRASFDQVMDGRRRYFKFIHDDLLGDGIIRKPIPNAHYWDLIAFPNQSSKTAYYDYMKLELPVMSNFVNSIFAADNTTINGTISPGIFYRFVDDVSTSTGLSLNDFPATVLTKRVFHSQFLASCNLFGGISQQNIKMLAENCCLYDNGEMPAITIKKLLKLYDPKIGWVGEVIAGVIALVGGIIAAVYEGEAKLERAKIESAKIDPLVAQQANFPTPSDAVMTDSLDWLPPVNPNNSNNTNNGGNNNNNKKKGGFPLVPAAAAAAGVLWWVSNNNNK